MYSGVRVPFMHVCVRPHVSLIIALSISRACLYCGIRRLLQGKGKAGSTQKCHS